MAINPAERLMAVGIAREPAVEIVRQINVSLPVEDGSITNAKIASDAAIATLKLADGEEIAALVEEETALVALAESDLVTAIGAPAAYSDTPADIAAALVAAGLMAPND